VVKAIGEAARRALQAHARPLDAARLRALSPLLFIVPHPDDEVLGCGGLIAEASDRDLDVRVVYLTDGAASHRGSPTWPPDRLARTRRAEALSALTVLGVAPEDVLFLDWPDAAPHPPLSPAFTRSVETVIRWLRDSPPLSVWAPYREEGHCDHRAAWALARAVRRLCRSPPPALLEYLVWGWNDSGVAEDLRDRTVWRLACARQIARRRRALACHATQLGGLIGDAAQSFTLPDTLTALTDCPSELYLER
jgi:LmbE family N-acetylglucosaminyl deacetylase